MQSRSEKEQSNAGYAFCQMKSALWTPSASEHRVSRDAVFILKADIHMILKKGSGQQHVLLPYPHVCVRVFHIFYRA